MATPFVDRNSVLAKQSSILEFMGFKRHKQNKKSLALPPRQDSIFFKTRGFLFFFLLSNIIFIRARNSKLKSATNETKNFL